MKSTPILTAVIASVGFATLPAHAATVIPLVNAGFETTTGTTSFPPATGWTAILTALHSAFPKTGNEILGTRFGFNNPSSGPGSQTVPTAMVANMTYTFQGYAVESGSNADLRFEIGYLIGSTFTPLAGTTYDLNAAAPTAWTLLDGVTYTTGSTGPELGQNITVRLRSMGATTQGVWFDEVSLTAIPEPSTTLVGLTFALALLRRRRRA